MRVTQRMRIENAIRHMEENTQKLQALEESIASGKQFQSISDNPSGATAALALRSSLEANKAYLDTTDVLGGWYAANELALKQLVELATRAINLTLSGVSDAQGPNERAALGVEVNELLHQAIEIGNSTHQNNYIFNGYQTTNKPFSVDEAEYPLYDSVKYYDEDNRPNPEVILRNIGPGQTIQQNIDGNTVISPLFDALIAARDALMNRDPDTDFQTRIQAAVGGLQAALETVSQGRTINAARQRQVSQLAERLEKAQIELKSLLTQKEGVNMAEAISTLRYQETVYQSVLEVGHRAISALSLFDLLS